MAPTVAVISGFHWFSTESVSYTHLILVKGVNYHEHNENTGHYVSEELMKEKGMTKAHDLSEYFITQMADVMQGNLTHTIVAILLVAGIAFLFTTVAANAIAIVGTNQMCIRDRRCSACHPSGCSFLRMYRSRIFTRTDSTGRCV